METRTFKNGDKISLLGFGAMRLPVSGENQADIDARQAEQMVDMALEHGVNYYDTAYMYHNGASESFLGRALSRYPRESFKLATKMPPWMIQSEADLERIFSEQLARCRVDYFDYYLVHNVSSSKLDNIRRQGLIEKLNRKKEQGLIRRFGFSYHDRADFLETMLQENDWDFVQIQLNYLDWEMQDARQLYNLLSDHGLPVIVMEPVRGGALATLSESAAGVLKASRPYASPTSWALRFAGSLPNVLTVLSGMSNLEQLRDNLQTFENFKPLSPEEKTVLDQAIEAYRKAAAVPCTACRYCMDCPSGVDIPRVFAIYNEYRATKIDNTFLLNLGVLGEDKQPQNCVQCGNCQPNCPQHLAIAELMEGITAKFKELSRKELPAWLKV